jgi:PhnB protein
VGNLVELEVHVGSGDAGYIGTTHTFKTGGHIIVSKIQVSPYINFQGRAREAMEFYHKVLGGNLELQTIDEQGVSRPAGPGDSIMYSRLQTDGALIIGVDGSPKYPAQVGENMALAVGGTDKERLNTVFNGLAEGGRIKMPLTRQPWGSYVGWLTDKFGINWTVSVDKNDKL